MSNIAFFSDNADFLNDLLMKIERYVPEAKVCDIESGCADIVVIDENTEKYKFVRSSQKSIPLIMLSSKNVDIDENSLNIVIRKPFSLFRFLDIIRSANNKLDASSEGYLTFGNYQLRPVEKEIEDLKCSEVVKLTEKEISIIKYLYKNRDVYISKNELQENVWKYNNEVSTHTVETHIYRLRRKVEKNSGVQLILTDKGGYKLNTEN